jgi:DNA replication protein DnaC
MEAALTYNNHYDGKGMTSEVPSSTMHRQREERIGERMRPRLQEMCVAVEMQGEDFRQKIKRASFA